MNAKRLAVVVAGVLFGVVAYRTQVDDLRTGAERAIAQVAVGAAFLLAGLVAWSRRRRNPLGPLMIAAGFALLARQFRYSGDALAFTVFFALGDLGYALVAHTALAYPSGHVRDRWERRFLRVTYAAVLVFPIATLLFYDASRPLRGFGPLPRESLLLVYADGRAAELLQKTFVVVAFGGLASIFVLLVVRKLLTATPRARRVLAPLLLAAVVAALRAVIECAVTFRTPPPSFVVHNLFWWQIGALAALPAALLAGLLRSRLARASIGDLIVRLERSPTHAIRDELARAFDDPSLEVAFWLPERGEFVDARGQPISMPAADDGERAVTTLDHDGVPLAALVHDATLRDEPKLVEAAGAAARLALENARLHAEVHSQLAKVKESRSRLVEAADDERRRIERDLHDGAQQRLVALALELRTAQQDLGYADDQAFERLLESAVDELQTAVAELRELARGIHPAVLTESGLVTALDSLALRSPVPVSVASEVDDRPPPSVEATAYFVACKALANVVKHSRAAHATIRCRRTDHALVIEVTDDGVGGARLDGSGLRGLADRVEAHGGRLHVVSPCGGGTHIVGEIPCAS
jgi:signal transduction histidine kinase